MATKSNKEAAQQPGAATQGARIIEGQELHITEGRAGTWYYHLSQAGINATAVCGAKTMHTEIPLSAWGVRGHLNERWCPTCAELGAAALSAAGVIVQNSVANQAKTKSAENGPE